MSLLDEVREREAIGKAFGHVRDDIVGSEVVIVVAFSLSSALADFRPKGGKLGTLYIRESTDTYSFIATREVVKVALVEPDVVRAALAVAERQWQRLTIRGSTAFKELAAREAVRLGLADCIVNPELQSAIAAERARLATENHQAGGRRHIEARPVVPVIAPSATANSQRPAATPKMLPPPVPGRRRRPI